MRPVRAADAGLGARRPPGRLLAALALLVAAALGGCDLGPQSAPQALDARHVPYGLLSPSHRATPTSLPGVDSVRVTVYLQGRSERLVAVQRSVAYPATVGAALDELAAGPTLVESDRGLVSPASSVGPLGAGLVRRGVVPVFLPTSFASLGGQDQVMAAAQIVYTVTAFAGVRGARLYVGGQTAQVPKANGSLTTGPLTRADYSSLGPSVPGSP